MGQYGRPPLATAALLVNFDVKIKNHGLGQYGAEPLIARLPFRNVEC